LFVDVEYFKWGKDCPGEVQDLQKRNIVAGLDIGTSKICAIIGEVNRNNRLDIVGIGVSPSAGIKKGVIVDIDSTVDSITQAVKKAEQMANVNLGSVFINYTGGNINLLKNRGIVAVTGENKEITHQDIERVIQAARVVAVPSDKEIIDIMPIEFIVDGYNGIKDPMGMVGTRLEVDAYIIMGSTTSVQNLIKSVQRSGLMVEGIILGPLAASQIILSRDEKELGVALLDIGGGTSDISIFSGGNLIFTATLPIGGEHITNDIAIGLRIPISLAEGIKKSYGCALISHGDPGVEIEIKRIGDQQASKITQQDLAEIIEPRVQEIFVLIKRELSRTGNIKLLPAGAVITGGGVYSLKGAQELASQILDMPVRMGNPEYLGANEPMFSVAVGIIEFAFRNKGYRLHITDKKKNIQGIFLKMKDWIRDYF
jgi:cell division protein FtsA